MGGTYKKIHHYFYSFLQVKHLDTLYQTTFMHCWMYIKYFTFEINIVRTLKAISYVAECISAHAVVSRISTYGCMGAYPGCKLHINLLHSKGAYIGHSSSASIGSGYYNIS